LESFFTIREKNRDSGALTSVVEIVRVGIRGEKKGIYNKN
jgi:hypothetical protein